MNTRPTLEDVLILHEGDDFIEDKADCMICGEGFAVSQKVLYVPAGFGPTNSIILVHLHCAVKQDEIDLGDAK